MDFKEGDQFVALKNDERFPPMLEITKLTPERIKYEPIGRAEHYEGNYATPDSLRLAVSQGVIKKIQQLA